MQKVPYLKFLLELKLKINIPYVLYTVDFEKELYQIGGKNPKLKNDKQILQE